MINTIELTRDVGCRLYETQRQAEMPNTLNIEIPGILWRALVYQNRIFLEVNDELGIEMYTMAEIVRVFMAYYESHEFDIGVSFFAPTMNVPSDEEWERPQFGHHVAHRLEIRLYRRT